VLSKKGSGELGAALFTVLGFVVVGLLSVQLHGSGVWLSRTPRPYAVKAAFDNVGGLKVGAPVKLAGVKVGYVTAISLEASRGYKAVVVLVLDTRHDPIPLDSTAAIQSASLLGGNFIAITLGGDANFLVDRSEIHTTNSAFSLERLIEPLACGHHPNDCATNIEDTGAVGRGAQRQQGIP
jgi:phospholipid/cholesterol/gamma-HCH transport system substrate-binding protein